MSSGESEVWGRKTTPRCNPNSFEDVSQLFSKLDYQQEVPLAPMTTYRIGGAAKHFVVLHSVEDSIHFAKVIGGNAIDWFFLGGGSNILVHDEGVDNLVVTLGKEFATIENGPQNTVKVGARAKFPALTKHCLGLGMRSAKGWIGTPGHVGGALVMNAGTRDGELGDVVRSVQVLNTENAEISEWSHEECAFQYRSSGFGKGKILLSAELYDPEANVMSAERLSREAKELLRKRHSTQPKERSAGSLFKNPNGDHAGRLIEAVGLKGHRVGNAQISMVHANFFVNLGDARASDIVSLANEAYQRVKSEFGVELEWEIKRVGNF